MSGVTGDVLKLGLSRRQFALLLGSSCSSLLSNSVVATAQSHLEKDLFLSATTDNNNQHWLTAFTLTDQLARMQFKQLLPGRAHHIAVHQEKGIFVVVARRPGTFLLVGDLQTGAIFQTIEVPNNRHLFGHGIFSSDGQYFYTVESDYHNDQGNNGRVAVWEVTRQTSSVNFTRLKEFSTFGVGPHELMLMPDQEALVIANGGIRTHPDSGREKLNINTMKPSLVYLNKKTGELLEQHKLGGEYHQASIRHLDVNAQGRVALVMQYEGEPFNAIPLVATHQRGEDIQLLDISPLEQQQMKQYVGSVKFDLSGRFIAASCPRGNRITFWDTESGEYLQAVRSRDGCGISATQNGFLFTAGTGRISHFDLLSNELNVFENTIETDAEKVFWDNHLSSAALISVSA